MMIYNELFFLSRTDEDKKLDRRLEVSDLPALCDGGGGAGFTTEWINLI